MRQALNSVARLFGYQIIKTHHAEFIYQHDYKGGYKEYRKAQIEANRRKLDHVWADPQTLSAIADDLEHRQLGRSGICHGARNGFEVEWFRDRLGSDIIGTDIAETARQFPHLEVWDFHQARDDWNERFDFVYTNSLDQAMEPARALKTWAKQIVPHGRIYIEHTMAHSPLHANETDPFGAHPLVMPYLLFQWGRGDYELADIIEIESKENNEFRVWVFVLTRINASQG